MDRADSAHRTDSDICRETLKAQRRWARPPICALRVIAGFFLMFFQKSLTAELFLVSFS